MKQTANISSVQFFLLFCLCFFSVSTVFLTDRMSSISGSAAWISPLMGGLLIIILMFLLGSILKADGMGMGEKAETILGKPIGKIITSLMFFWTVIVASFVVRHFSERVLLVYITDASFVFIILCMMGVVLASLVGGLLGYARLCEVLFYIFLVVFIFVTVVAFFDGVKAKNIFTLSISDSKSVLQSSVFLLVPFSILVCMTFFTNRVNFKSTKALFYQGTKSVGFVVLSFMAVLMLTIGTLGVVGVKYLQMPYFVTTRQVQILGPLKNIGSIVFSLWIFTDFAVIATLCYSAASMGQCVLNIRHRKIPIYIITIVVTIISIFAWRDYIELNTFFDKFILPSSVVLSVGIPVILFIVGKIRKKI